MVNTSTFYFEHWNPDGMYSNLSLPRQYLGPFDTIAVGTGEGCEIDPNTHACKGPREPIGAFTDQHLDREGTGWWAADVDNLVLLDGVLTSADGACCKPDGTCAVLPLDTCINQDGVFRGIQTTCQGTSCTGACCGPMNSCNDAAYGACPGSFQGIGTACATATCPCPVPFADVDMNGWVDMSDFGAFQACYTGSGYGSPLSAQCKCWDRNHDGSIDGTDFNKFVSCATGPNIPLTPEQKTACNTGP